MLSSMIKNAESDGDVQGVVVSRGGIRVSLLFFVNDNILFCHATLEEWDRVKAILGNYERGEGQVVNNIKSSLFFLVAIPP